MHLALLTGSFIVGEIMNIRVEKTNNKNNDVITFLSEESLKLFLELNPKFKELYNDVTHNYKEIIRNHYIIEHKKTIQEDGNIYVAYNENNIVGVGYIENDNYLKSLFVKEEFRNMGIGTKILEKLISECSKNGIISVNARIGAISLYERLGFTRTESDENNVYVPMELGEKTNGK